MYTHYTGSRLICYTSLHTSTAYPSFFFFHDTATTEIYTLSLHDALPICSGRGSSQPPRSCSRSAGPAEREHERSEEHTSELQSLTNLVCRLLLEKKKKIGKFNTRTFLSRIARRAR